MEIAGEGFEPVHNPEPGVEFEFENEAGETVFDLEIEGGGEFLIEIVHLGLIGNIKLIG